MTIELRHRFPGAGHGANVSFVNAPSCPTCDADVDHFGGGPVIALGQDAGMTIWTCSECGSEFECA